MKTEDPPVLVTGSTGFTGKALTIELLKQGQRVKALVRDRQQANELAGLGAELVEGDLRNPEAVDRAARGCRRIYHLAAAFRTAGKPNSYYEEINAEAVRTVLEAAKRHEVERAVHCSTVGVHGHVTQIPSDEQAPYNPGDIYQETKLAGERIAQEAIKRGEPVSIVRPAGIYGPGDLRFLKLFKTIKRGTFRMFGDGKTLYHFTYIDDLVNGIITCGEHPSAEGNIFIICGDEYVELNELVKTIAETLSTRVSKLHLPLWPLLAAARICEGVCAPFRINPPLHMRRCEFFTKDRAFTNEKAKRVLDFQPRTSLADGIQKTALWYRSSGLL